MNGSIAWTAEQIRGLKPQAARQPDAVERTVEWVGSMRRRVTWEDLARAHDIGRYEAMRRLRHAADRGFIVRHRVHTMHRPDEFEAVRR